MPAPPVFQQAAATDAIVIGRVTSIEDKEIELQVSPSHPDKLAYRVAVVKVVEPLKGAKGVKEVRLAFRSVKPRYGVQVTAGLEGIFRLTRHFKEPLYLTPMWFDITRSAVANYAQQVGQLRRLGKLADDSAAGLKSKDPEVRYLSAALIIMKYRTNRLWAVGKLEPVGAAESKQLLGALLAADWGKARPEGDPLPLTVFLRLGVPPKDGWVAPPGGPGLGDITKAARNWLTQHVSDYRIQRYAGTGPAKKAP
jgi:hypothetical protein